MKPHHQVSIIDIDSPPATPPRTSDSFEQIDYPQSHTSYSTWTQPRNDEELPLSYMTEDTAARRRVPRGPSALAKDGAYDSQEKNWEYDEEGKDVYAKAAPAAARMSSGRPARRGPPPPPTTIVRVLRLRTPRRFS